MLLLRGRPVVVEGAAGLAAAPPTTFDQARADLQNQVVAVVRAGDLYYQSHVDAMEVDYTDAVLAYQAAGQAGATNVGPEIDAAGAAQVTQPLTQQAWTINSSLAAIQKQTGASVFVQSDADKAKGLVSQMVTLYNQAITKGSGSVGQPAGPVIPPTPTPTTQASSALPVLALASVVAATATVMIRRTRR